MYAVLVFGLCAAVCRAAAMEALQVAGAGAGGWALSGDSPWLLSANESEALQLAVKAVSQDAYTVLGVPPVVMDTTDDLAAFTDNDTLVVVRRRFASRVSLVSLSLRLAVSLSITCPLATRVVAPHSCLGRSTRHRGSPQLRHTWATAFRAGSGIA